MKLSLSPGHYPESPGAIGEFNQKLATGGFRRITLYEHYEVLSVVAKTREFLSNNKDIKLVDTPISSLSGKVTTINESGADLAIEIHLNSTENKNAFGPLCIAESKKGKEVSGKILNRINEIDQIQHDERIWDCMQLGRQLYFILQTKMPAVIVECFFLSNKSDLTWWIQGWNTAEILGQKIGMGIIDSLNLF